MKKIILLLNILFLSFFCVGQDNKFGVSLSAGIPEQDPKYFSEWISHDLTHYKLQRNSFFSELTGSYNYNDTVVFRLNAGITLLEIDQKDNYYSGNYGYIDETKDQQKNIHIAPGIVWKLTNNKIQLFGGAEVPFSFLGKTINTFNEIQTDINSGNTTSADETITTVPGGYSIGIGGIIGVSYFPCKKLSIETEFSPSLLFSNISGKLTRTGEAIYPTNTSYISEELDYKFQGFYFDERFSIRLTYWFGKKY